MSSAAKTDLVTNSLATRWTLRRILRPSSIAKGIASKLSLTSTTSATPLASWLPEPSATATSHSLSAGTSLTPSPIMPDAPAAASQRRHELALVLGLDAREDGVVDRAASQRAGLLRELGARSSRARRCRCPAARATAATVAGPSPEMILTSTPARCR